MKILNNCFICETASMMDSKDGVTCGNVSCAEELPYKIEELKDRNSELELDNKSLESRNDNLEVKLKKIHELSDDSQ